jgi:hypothetical protein
MGVGESLCQSTGFFACADYAAGQRYCGLGNGGTDPVYFDDFSFGDFDSTGKPAILCGPCDCNCEWHCVPWNLAATIDKISNGNPDCDDYDPTVLSLTQVGGTGEDACRWDQQEDPVVFCGEYDVSLKLYRLANTSVDGADLSDFRLEIDDIPMIGSTSPPLIPGQSTCKPLQLVFGPLDLEYTGEPPGPDCCTWNITITE